MEKLRLDHPQLQFLKELPYVKHHLGEPGDGFRELPVRELFPVPFSAYLALEAMAESVPRVARLTPSLGSFSLEQAELLVPILSDFTKLDRIYGFYHPHFLAREEEPAGGEALAYSFTLRELTRLMAMPRNDFSPTLWWPEGREWFFLNDLDRSCGVFGGSESLAKVFRECLPFRVAELSGAASLEEVDQSFWSNVGTLDEKVFG